MQTGPMHRTGILFVFVVLSCVCVFVPRLRPVCVVWCRVV